MRGLSKVLSVDSGGVHTGPSPGPVPWRRWRQQVLR